MVRAVLDIVVPVFNGEDDIPRLLHVLLQQRARGDAWGRVIVVDDGSTDRTADAVTSYLSDRVHLIRAKQNRGRGNACNLGVAQSTADAVLFLDADCRPAVPDLFERHARALAAGAGVSCGRIEGGDTGFWQRHAKRVADERERRVEAGDFLALTTCNTAVARPLLDAVGGFHPGYRRYGFEDRDIFVTLMAQGASFRYDAQAVVAHDVDTSVPVLCAKMEAAARYSAPVFRRRHPAVYGKLIYARLDANTADWWVRRLTPLASRLSGMTTSFAGWLVDRAWLGDPMKVAVLRFATALAYLKGSRLPPDRLQQTLPKRSNRAP